MKRMFFFSVIALSLFACSGVAEPEISNEGEINGISFFDGTWEEALEKANSEGKLIFLDAYAEWCNPCKRMSQNEFGNEHLGAYFNEHFINFKMDMEKGVGPELAQRFALSSYPTLYFVDCTGKAVSTNIGYHTADQLLDLGKIYVDQAPTECK